MELEFRQRNHDMCLVLPTFQERVNAMLPVNRAESAPGGALDASAAPALERRVPATPHMLNADELREALIMVEREAEERSQALIEAHCGLNERRVQRLLGLLD